jgi:hypothetical protein
VRIEASLGYIGRCCLKKQKTKNKNPAKPNLNCQKTKEKTLIPTPKVIFMVKFGNTGFNISQDLSSS